MVSELENENDKSWWEGFDFAIELVMKAIDEGFESGTGFIKSVIDEEVERYKKDE